MSYCLSLAPFGQGGVAAICLSYKLRPFLWVLGVLPKLESALREARATHEGGYAMSSNSARAAFATVALILASVCVFQTRSAQPGSATTAQTAAKPLLLEKNEGERRIWREPPPGDFVLKVSR